MLSLMFPRSLHGDLSRVFSTVFDGDGTRSAPLSPAVDVSEDADAIRVSLDLPGIAEKDVSIELDGDTLTISGERQPVAKEGEKQHRAGRWHGRFLRSLTLPTGVDAEHIEAAFAKGVLTVRLPKIAAQKARRIAISAA